MATTRAMIERRRASRVPIHLGVSVFYDGEDGNPQQTPAVAVGVSRCGALLRVPFAPAIGCRIQLQNDSTQETREFRVIRVSEPKRDGTREVGVEMLYPTRNFWRVRFPDDSPEDPLDDSVEPTDAPDLAIHHFPRI